METQLKTVRLDVKLIEALKEISIKENRNFTNTVETLLKESVQKRKEREK